MSAQRAVIYGSRPDGHAKVLVDLLAARSDLTVVGLVDDFRANQGRRIRGLEVLGTGEDLPALRAAGVESVLLGFGDPQGRVDAIARAKAAGLTLPTLVHPSAVVSLTAVLEQGCQVLAGAYVGPDARLGEGALVNTHAVIEHDVRVASGSVVAPAGVLAGRAQLGVAAAVGAGATILPDVVVGDAAIVGAGAVVAENVRPGDVVVGVPARPRG